MLDISKTPWWTLTAGIEGPMSLDVAFLGESLASYEARKPIRLQYGSCIRSKRIFARCLPAPVLSQLSPSQVDAGSSSFDLLAQGSNFVPGATVMFGNTALSTTWQSSAQLSATLPAALLGL